MYRNFVIRAAIIVALAVGSSACYGLENLFSSPSSPSDPSVKSYVGAWTTQSITAFPTQQSCGNLQWQITSQTGNQVAGTFKATCAGGITLSGTASGTVGDTLIWAAAGTATQGTTSCPFSLNGTGTFQGTSAIVVSYAGTTCFGPVSGSETFRR